MEVYLDVAVSPLLLALLLQTYVADCLENVTNVRTSAHQDSHWRLGGGVFVVLKDVAGRRHAPELNVANLIHYLHHLK